MLATVGCLCCVLARESTEVRALRSFRSALKSHQGQLVSQAAYTNHTRLRNGHESHHWRSDLTSSAAGSIRCRHHCSGSDTARTRTPAEPVMSCHIMSQQRAQTFNGFLLKLHENSQGQFPHDFPHQKCMKIFSMHASRSSIAKLGLNRKFRYLLSPHRTTNKCVTNEPQNQIEHSESPKSD
jgi:hypothetical protein